MNCPRCGKEATDSFLTIRGARLIACPCVPDGTAVQLVDRRERPRLERADFFFIAGLPYYFRGECPSLASDEWIVYIPEPKR